MIAIILLIISADFPICTAVGFQQNPAVTFANDQFYVFWIDARVSNRMGVYGARVTKTGTVLDGGGRLLYMDSASYSCDVAYDGSNFLIVTRNHC